MNIVGSVWSLSPFPRPPKQRGPADSASNTSQYSGSGRGSQPPEGGILLPCCFALLVEVPLPGHAEGKEHAESIPVLSDPNHPSEAKIHSFEGLWLTSGLVMLVGAGLSLPFLLGSDNRRLLGKNTPPCSCA